MRAVYLIGNGFDVSRGLPTRYNDFYDYNLGLDRSHDSENIKKLKEHLKRCLSEKINIGLIWRKQREIIQQNSVRMMKWKKYMIILMMRCKNIYIYNLS